MDACHGLSSTPKSVSPAVAKVGSVIAGVVAVIGPAAIKIFGKTDPQNVGAFYISTAVIVAAALFTVALVYSVDVFSRATASAAKSANTAQPSSPGASPDSPEKTLNLVAVAVEPFEVGFTGEIGRYQVRMVLVDTTRGIVNQYYVQAQGCAPAWVDGAKVTE